MMSEKMIKVLLQDLITVYAVGDRIKDLDSRTEKKAQILILKWILETNNNKDMV